MMLAKYSAPRSLRPDMESFFLQDKSRISRFIDEAVLHVFRNFAYTLSFQQRRLREQLPVYAAALAQYIGVPQPHLFRTFGFVDGVFRYCARPSRK